MLKYLTIYITAILAFCPPAFSQKGSAESDSTRAVTAPGVTVTATRAEEGISPAPFSEIDREELKMNYINRDMPKVLLSLPSVTAYSQNGNFIGYSNLSLRGFDQRRISVMINGIPQNDPEDHQVYWIDFPDLAANVENIQVQRGAGLALYGAAPIGGSINLITSNFTQNRGISLYSGLGFQQYGSGGEEKLQPAMSKFSIEASSGLVNDKYAVYARLSSINSEGYRDRSWANLRSYFLSAARFDKNFSTKINIYGGPIEDGLAYTGLPKSYIKDKKLRRLNPSAWAYEAGGKEIAYFVNRRPQEIENFSQPHYELLNDWIVNENLTIKSSLFYYTGEGFFDFDGSWADTSMLNLTAANGYSPEQNPRNTIIRAWVSNKQGGWIPRLIWKHGAGQLIAGAEMRIHRSDHWGEINYAENLPSGFDPDYKFYSNNGERDILSAFARERLQLTDKLHVSLEAQLVRHSFRISDEMAGNNPVTYTNIDGEQVGGEDESLFEVNYVFFNPRIGAMYNLNNEMNIYGLVAYTSREPRMRNLYAADDKYFGAQPLFNGEARQGGQVWYDFSNPIAKPESMLDIELGWSWRTDIFRASANIYWMEYFDELVKSGQLDIVGNPIDGNADRARHYGLELTGSAELFSGPWGRLEMLANATFSRNEIIEYDFNTFDNKLIELAGNDIAGFPNAMANARLVYINEGLYAAFSGMYVGKYYTDNFGSLARTNADLINHMRNDFVSGYYSDNILDAYTVFNLDLSYSFRDVLSMQAIRLQAQVLNLFNELYAAGAEGKDFFPAAERSIFFGIELNY